MSGAAAEKKPVNEAKAEIESLACFAWQAMLIDPSTAAALFAELTVRVPKSSSYWGAYGMALAKLNQHGQAIAAFERALELQPKNIEVWCIVGELSIDLMDWKRAARALKMCLDLDPQSRHPSGVRARALIKKGEKLLSQATKG